MADGGGAGGGVDGGVGYGDNGGGEGGFGDGGSNGGDRGGYGDDGGGGNGGGEAIPHISRTHLLKPASNFSFASARSRAKKAIGKPVSPVAIARTVSSEADANPKVMTTTPSAFIVDAMALAPASPHTPFW